MGEEHVEPQKVGPATDELPVLQQHALDSLQTIDHDAFRSPDGDGENIAILLRELGHPHERAIAPAQQVGASNYGQGSWAGHGPGADVGRLPSPQGDDGDQNDDNEDQGDHVRIRWVRSGAYRCGYWSGHSWRLGRLLRSNRH